MDPQALSIIGWGKPSDPRTFSGYSRHLAEGLVAAGIPVREYSARNLRARDILFGAMVLGRDAGGRIRPQVARDWMWGLRGNEVLSERLLTLIRRANDSGPFLQVGTLVSIPQGLGEHYVLTDMTIPQAAREGYFAVARLQQRRLREALDVQRRVIDSAVHVFTLTEWAKSSVVEDYGRRSEDVTVVYMGSNLPETHLATVKKPQQILFVGIDWERKGGPEMVAGFRLLKTRVPEAELVIVGCSPRTAVPGIRVLGYMSPRLPSNRIALAQLFAESACLCMLSDYEPLGNVFIEAYAAGLPVIAYDRGSRAEIVEHDRTGILCMDRSPETVARAMERMITDAAFRDRAGSRARELATSRFSWSRVASIIKARIARKK